MFGESEVDRGPQAYLSATSGSSPYITKLMLEMSLEPGQQPGYELCKQIYSTHPLGHKMAAHPVTLALSQEREILIESGPEEMLTKAFKKEWDRLGGDGGNRLVHNIMTLARVYGIATLAVGLIQKNGTPYPADKPLDLAKIGDSDRLFFNILDPLNTAGSLVLNQDAESPDFMKPVMVQTGSIRYHPSRTVVVMNEQPIWIQWTDSAFGFVGRSVYQRALYPMKSYLQSMISDNAVQEKLMTLIYKMVSPGSVVDRIGEWFGFKKRASIKYAKAGNVVSIGKDEDVASIDLQHVKEAGEYSRKNILDNIATAASMPAILLNQETLAEGFGEGTEDAKIIARYIGTLRQEMDPVYRFLDPLVMALAWNEDFYRSVQKALPDVYGKVPYETAFMEWKNGFSYKWPNLLEEPDSEKAKKSDIKLKSVTAVLETLLPVLDPENKARLIEWAQEQISGDEFLFDGTLDLDTEALATYVPPSPVFGNEEEKEPRAPEPFGYRS